jgi:hypothetical protein
MNLQQLAKKLRNAADVIDDLLNEQRLVNVVNKREISKKIIRHIKKRRSFKGKHWTQTPEGKIKLSEMSKKAWRKRENQA